MSLFSYKSKDQIKVFRWSDALTFGLLGLLADLILGYFLFNAENLTTSAGTLLCVLGLMFWIPYVMVLLARIKWVKKISFVTKHGLPVVTNDFPVKKEDVERITDETIEAWNTTVHWNKSAEAIQTLFIEFRSFPIVEKNNVNRKFAGLLKNKWAIVGFKDDLNKTALSHELGHEIHYAWSGGYNNDACHDFMRAHKLK